MFASENYVRVSVSDNNICVLVTLLKAQKVRILEANTENKFVYHKQYLLLLYRVQIDIVTSQKLTLAPKILTLNLL